MTNLFDKWSEETEQLGSTNCPGCGKFSKITGYHSYFNGLYECCTMYTYCKNCGALGTELV